MPTSNLVAPSAHTFPRKEGHLKTLVTGGAGLIGSHLCAALLEEGHSVICVDSFLTGLQRNIEPLSSHPDFQFVQHDVCRPLPDQYSLDLIFHLASPASVADYLSLPIETLRVNSLGTLHLLELARSTGAKFLFSSTSEVYGEPAVHPQVESYWGNVNPNGPRSCYAESKRFGEAATLTFYRTLGVDARLIRIFNTYGPHSRSDDGRVLPNFITQALRNQPLTIYGDGSQTRSYCYVSDLVRGIILAMLGDHTSGEVFNLGNPDEYTVLDFARVIAREVGSTAGFVYEPLPEDDPSRRRPDVTKARDMLGWEPRVDLVTGIAATIDWFREGLRLPATSVKSG